MSNITEEKIDWKLYDKNLCAIHNLVNLDVLLINEIVGHDVASTINNEELCRSVITRHVRSIIYRHLVSIS